MAASDLKEAPALGDRGLRTAGRAGTWRAERRGASLRPWVEVRLQGARGQGREGTGLRGQGGSEEMGVQRGEEAAVMFGDDPEHCGRAADVSRPWAGRQEALNNLRGHVSPQRVLGTRVSYVFT